MKCRMTLVTVLHKATCVKRDEGGSGVRRKEITKHYEDSLETYFFVEAVISVLKMMIHL